jgi:hypothetical protein
MSSDQAKLNTVKSSSPPTLPNEVDKKKITDLVSNSKEDIREALKRTSQIFFLIISIIGCYFPVIIIYEFSSIKQWMQDTFPAPEIGWGTWSDFHITMLAACVSYVSNKLTHKIMWNFFYRNCRE